MGGIRCSGGGSCGSWGFSLFAERAPTGEDARAPIGRLRGAGFRGGGGGGVGGMFAAIAIRGGMI